MNIEDIKRRVEMIYTERDDDEKAHDLEDDLMRDFIAYIAEERQLYAEMASEVAKSWDIEFSRWCA